MGVPGTIVSVCSVTTSVGMATRSRFRVQRSMRSPDRSPICWAKPRGVTSLTLKTPCALRWKVAPKGGRASQLASVHRRTVWSAEALASQRPSAEGASP